MKKIFPYILILGTVTMILVPIHFSHAQAVEVASAVSNAVALAGAATFATVKFASEYFFQGIFTAILTVMSWLLWLSGQLLNYVLYYTVIQMKTNLGDLTGINTAWKIIRDLMNIAFIFMLVYEGIMLIIGQGSTTQIKKFIIGIVMAALLINFSLFFSKIIIDASNVVTVGFYNNILGTNAKASDVFGLDYGLSNPIVKSLGLTTLYKADGDATFGKSAGLSGIFIMGFGSGLLILIASFVFFAISILFIVRYVALLILLMLSPIAYMGMALPFMNYYSKQWWESFKAQLLFGPIFMIMMWVILTLMKSKGFINITSDTGFTDLITSSGKAPAPSSFNLILNYVVIIGLLIAALVIAKSTAKKGSSLIGDFTKRVSAFAGGVVAGGTARISRNTVGRAGNAISNSGYLKDKEVSGNLFTKNLAKYTRSAGTKTATSSFDVRATSGYSAIADATGIKNDFGKPLDKKKVNFQKELEDKGKREAEYAKSLKPTDVEKDRIKEQTGHTALEQKEKQIKTGIDNYEKVAKELQTKKEGLENELVNAKDLEMKAQTEAEKDITRTRVKNLEDQIESTKQTYNTQVTKQEELKASLKTATANVKGSQTELDKIFGSRVEAYAKSFENESRAVRYAKNAFRIPLSVVSGARPTTKGDNIEIARKIRKDNSEKSKKDQFTKLAKEVLEAEGAPAEEETPAEPKPAEPATTPPPTT